MTEILAVVDSKGHISALIELFTRQLELYRQLGELSLQQTQAVKEGLTEQLLALLQRRSQVIDAVAAINRELEPYRSDWARLQSRLEPAQRQRIGTLIQQIEALRDAIVQQDNCDRDRLETAQGKISAELTKLVDASRAHGAYGSRSAAQTPYYTDRHG
tara:strand:- start:296 stop:772 length:477 start_codon:yes stop_codon:yes gene_type:complete